MISDTNLLENEKKDDDQEKENDPVSTSTITNGLHHIVSKIQKVFSSVEHVEEILSYINKIENFPSKTYSQNLKQKKKK